MHVGGPQPGQDELEVKLVPRPKLVYLEVRKACPIGAAIDMTPEEGMPGPGAALAQHSYAGVLLSVALCGCRTEMSTRQW